MGIRTSHIATVLATAAVALAVVVAPTANAASSANTRMSCAETGGGTECQTPGNVQLDDSPPPVSFDPYGDYGLLLGGFGNPGFRGGFHGGGFHGGGFGGGGHR
ncbi:hypothetical protein CQY20_30275 [Mycolicibacterium agri]|uniref:Keratin associated protein n=1 Tax=Mycolicibacterium agri TaxID=36811 RepID=A0A2A7MPC7_MYCAG|nr:hypothetical protein [Mycolicibacterium agri]PEG33534.1 hypothetical protein CQY20_30275 [Mycolicibacterium agri]GFG49017.1 hypothetical protein MAGR_04580 [Mycolicibacterium agri]